MMYIVFTEDMFIDGHYFFWGVSFEFTEQGDNYVVVDNNISYSIPKNTENMVLTDRVTRTINEPANLYYEKKSSDNTPDYFPLVEKAFGVDLKQNVFPQYRDGVNPMKIGRKN